MKNIDFTQPGGFPLTQDQLGYLQTAWQEVVDALLSTGVNAGAPTVLSGMVSSTVGGTTTVSAGWFVYNGQAVRFPSQTYATPVAGGDAVYVVVTPTATPLTFNNGSTPDVVQDSTGVLTVLPNTTPVDATHFLLGSLVAFNSAILNQIATIFTELSNMNPALVVSGASGLLFTIGGTGVSTYYTAANALAGAVITLPAAGGAIPQEYLFISSTTAGDQIEVVRVANVNVNTNLGAGVSTYTATNSTYVILRIKYLGNSAGTYYYTSEFLNPAV